MNKQKLIEKYTFKLDSGWTAKNGKLSRKVNLGYGMEATLVSDIRKEKYSLVESLAKKLINRIDWNVANSGKTVIDEYITYNASYWIVVNDKLIPKSNLSTLTDYVIKQVVDITSVAVKKTILFEYELLIKLSK